MSRAKDLDILARSLSGDWEARVELFKKFVWENSKVRRHGAASQFMDDFLHDCFTNILRAGQTLNADPEAGTKQGPTRDFGDWVESVAAWTALERQRVRSADSPGSSGRIRMCAGVETADGTHRVPISYMPPRSGPEDSLSSRIRALVGEPKFTLLSIRAVGDKTWDDVAAAAGQPPKTIGPILVRTVDFLSRFFGPPPPLNDDLEPVFSWVVRQEAAVTHGDPLRPKGRILAMQLDPAFYSVTPEMRAIGLAVPAEVRTITLWDAARASTPPSEALRDHLDKCHYCADLLRALILMQQALESDPGIDFLLCPGASRLIESSDKDYETFDRHLDECPLCGEERARFFGDAEHDRASAPGTKAGVVPIARVGPGRKFAWAAAVLLLLGAGYFAQHRYFAARSQPNVPTDMPATPASTVSIDPHYRDLAQPIAITDGKWLASVLPQNRHAFIQYIDLIQGGEGAEAELAVSGIAARDAGTQMLYSMLLYQWGTAADAYHAMLTSEAMPPRNSFRCWAMLQNAILVGDKEVAAREVEHLASEPEYAARARDLLARMKARG